MREVFDSTGAPISVGSEVSVLCTVVEVYPPTGKVKLAIVEYTRPEDKTHFECLASLTTKTERPPEYPGDLEKKK